MNKLLMMKSNFKKLTLLSFAFLLLSGGLINAQSKKIKRPNSKVGISTVDNFVAKSFNIYEKVYRYEGYKEAGKSLEDEDLDILESAIDDVTSLTAIAPNVISSIDGQNVIKQSKAMLQINRSKKALRYSVVMAQQLLLEKKKEDESEDTDSETTNTEDDVAVEDNSNQESTGGNSANGGGKQGPIDVKVYSKFDFVPGDKLMFFDDYSNDFIGDFPSNWNTNGSGEVVTLNDSPEKWLSIVPGSHTYYIPDVPDLPEEYTIEFDLFVTGIDKNTSSTAKLIFWLNASKEFNLGSYWVRASLPFAQYTPVGIRVKNGAKGKSTINNTVKADIRKAVLNRPHISIAVNKQRYRLWVNEKKYIDVPRMVMELGKINSIKFNLEGFKDGKERLFIGNLKVAEGGVDLRRQLINEGSVSTNGILFDSGSATIQPQSYGIIRQISQVLLQEREMKLKIIGHTDADGPDATNMTLSKKRAEAVKQALIAVYNIDGSRLVSDGKGESVPVGDNTTADGKAQNRRVEFIKM